jgi:predicted small lipoprotein YifL
VKRLLCLTGLLLLLAACGRRGALLPPEALVPAPIADLQVAQRGEDFELSWSRPTKTEKGLPLKDLAGFSLFRRVVLPPGEDCPNCPDSWRPLLGIDLEFPQGVRQAGNRFIVADADLQTGTTYAYQVRSYNLERATSRASNTVRRTAQTPPTPPTLQAVSSPTAIILTISPAPLPAPGSVVGANIYRQKPGEPPPLQPLNPEPVPANTFTDSTVRPGESYRYTARTVARIGGEMVESRPSSEVNGQLTEPD